MQVYADAGPGPSSPHNSQFPSAAQLSPLATIRRVILTLNARMHVISLSCFASVSLKDQLLHAEVQKTRRAK